MSASVVQIGLALAEVLILRAEGITVEHALGSVGLYHTGSFPCVTDPGVACGHAGDSVHFVNKTRFKPKNPHGNREKRPGNIL